MIDRQTDGVCSKGLAHIVMEAEKSHSLPSVSWRPRETSGVVQIQT